MPPRDNAILDNLEQYRAWVIETEPGTPRWPGAEYVGEYTDAELAELGPPCKYKSLREMLLDWGYAK